MERITYCHGTLTKAEIYAHLRPRFANMYLPDDIVFIAAMPKTSVGKFDKKTLWAQYADYQVPALEHTEGGM